MNTIAISYEYTPALHADILDAISYHASDILAITQGIGHYDNTVERAGIILISADSGDIPALKSQLSLTAASHGQSAIGFTAAPADTTLIFAGENS